MLINVKMFIILIKKKEFYKVSLDKQNYKIQDIIKIKMKGRVVL